MQVSVWNWITVNGLSVHMSIFGAQVFKEQTSLSKQFDFLVKQMPLCNTTMLQTVYSWTLMLAHGKLSHLWASTTLQCSCLPWASQPSTNELPLGQLGRGDKDETVCKVPLSIPEGSCHQAPCDPSALFRGLEQQHNLFWLGGKQTHYHLDHYDLWKP